MSEDLKAKFRAAAAQRGLPPAKDQLKAIRAQKASAAATAGSGPSSQRLQQQQGAQRPQQPAAPAPAAVPASRAAAAGGASLPADFFKQAPTPPPPSAAATAPRGPPSAPTAASAPYGASSQTRAQRPPGAAAAATGPGAAPSAGAGAPAALPEGFFSDKTADAKARGVKLPTAEDREAEFRAFTAVIDEELKQQAVEEAEEAEVEAEEKADREAFLLRRQQERLELLRQRKAALQTKTAAAADTASLPELPLDEELREAPPPAFGMSSDEEEEQGQEGQGAGPAAGRQRRATVPVLPGKRRRVLDVLAETLGAAEGGEGSSGEGSDMEDEAVVGGLNWRAKRV